MQEKVKFEKPGFAALDMLEQLAAEAKEKGGAQHCDDQPSVNLRLKWLGLFHRDKHMPGGFMWRMRCPNGSYTTAQWKEILKVMQHPDYQNYKDKDMWEQGACLTVTTRQNLQLYGIRLENVPDHWKALRGAGIFSLQAGMDNVRNLVGNPIAGIDPEEIVDTRPFCDEFTAKLTNNGNGNPEFSNMPRKFNVCFVGSKEMYEHPDINDIAYLPSKGPNGEMGWHIEVLAPPLSYHICTSIHVNGLTDPTPLFPLQLERARALSLLCLFWMTRFLGVCLSSVLSCLLDAYAETHTYPHAGLNMHRLEAC